MGCGVLFGNTMYAMALPTCKFIAKCESGDPPPLERKSRSGKLLRNSILPLPVLFDHLQQFFVYRAVAGHDLLVEHRVFAGAEAADLTACFAH